MAVRHVRRYENYELKEEGVGTTASWSGAYCTDIHAQDRHPLRLAAQGVRISGLAQQAPSSGAQQRCQLPAGGMGGAPTGRQPIDQAVAVGGEGR